MNKSLFLIILLLSCSCAIGQEAIVSAKIDESQSLDILEEAGRVKAIMHAGDKQWRLHIDKRLHSRLQASDSLSAVSPNTRPFGNEQLFALIARLPSASNPTGYCGSGHEDYLLLLSVRKKRLILLDEHMIASCINKISYATENSDDPKDIITAGKFPVIANYRTIAPPDYQVKAFRAVASNGKLRIEEIK